MASQELFFASDYMEGAHPAILERLLQTNLVKSPGYGTDPFTALAAAKIRAACQAPEADVFLLAGGTQTNATVITAMLRPYQGVVAADSGHISVHEAGAVECGGHKVLTVPSCDGKMTAEALEKICTSWEEDENREHMVMPGMVYISQPTESGTLYSLAELEALGAICRRHHLPLYLDGARLAYALACSVNDVSLPDIARLCDAFYIGGTKCGALFGEAVVFPKSGSVPHFFTIMKQRGALLAKGRITGLQFDTLFTDDLYLKVGKTALEAADRIRKALTEKGYALAYGSPTNQIFPILDNEQKERITRKVQLSFWEQLDDDHVIMRIATSWATDPKDVDALIELL